MTSSGPSMVFILDEVSGAFGGASLPLSVRTGEPPLRLFAPAIMRHIVTPNILISHQYEVVHFERDIPEFSLCNAGSEIDGNLLVCRKGSLQDLNATTYTSKHFHAAQGPIAGKDVWPMHSDTLFAVQDSRVLCCHESLGSPTLPESTQSSSNFLHALRSVQDASSDSDLRCHLKYLGDHFAPLLTASQLELYERVCEYFADRASVSPPEIARSLFISHFRMVEYEERILLLSYAFQREIYVVLEGVKGINRGAILPQHYLTHMACGISHVVVRSQDNSVFAWGSNSHGQLQLDDQSITCASPVRIPLLATACDAGDNHSAAVLTTEGRVVIWGSSATETLGVSVRCDRDRTYVFSSSGVARRFPGDECIEAAYETNLFVRSMLGNLLLCDKNLTDALQAMVRGCAGEVSFATVKVRLHDVPVTAVHSLQLRAIHWLRKRTSFRGVVCNTSLVSARDLITVRNPTNKDLEVRVYMPPAELAARDTMTFEASPASFKLGAGESIDVTLSCRDLKLSLKALYYTFVVETRARARFFVNVEVQPMHTSLRATMMNLFRDEEKAEGPNILSYVPNLVARLPAALTYAQVKEFDGAVLFIDISGFTTLTERLAKLGSSGPELVCLHLNSYYGSIIDMVHAHGGDVIKFAGDACICIFQQHEAALRATQCGMEVQQQLPEYDSGEGFVLTLHIGVGVGRLHACHVGGVQGAWQFLIIGDPFAQLSSAVENSHIGEVVVSPECWEQIEAFATGERRGERDYLVHSLLTSPPPQPLELAAPKSLEHLMAYIPLPVRNALETGWSAELRRVSVLFVKLESLSYEAGTALNIRRINDVFRSMQTTIARFEGTVIQFMVDDKGTLLICVFGLPPLFHEDDAKRAVLASLQLHKELAERGVHNSIGVTTGSVFSGSLGSTVRQEYTVLGDVVNLSARLMVAASKSGHGVLCCRHTRDACAGVEFEVLQPINVKGKTELIEIFRPAGAMSAKVGQGSLKAANYSIVGRDYEKRRLDDAKLGLVVLYGISGVGKTKMLEHLKDRNAITGYCEPLANKEEPFQVLKSVLQAIVGRLGQPLMRRWLQNQQCSVVGLIFTLLRPDSAKDYDVPVVRPLTESQRRSHLSQLVYSLLYFYSEEESFTVIFEGIQWMDDISTEIIFKLCSSHRVLCVCTARPTVVPHPLVEKARVRGTLLHLKALSPAKLCELVQLHVGCDEAHDEVMEYIEERSDGIPYFAQQMVEMLLRDGFIEVNEDREMKLLKPMSEAQELGAPQGVDNVINSWIDQLEPGPQMLLKIASCIGREFSWDHVCQMFPGDQPVPVLDDHLAQLVNLLILSPADKSASTYRFVLFSVRASMYLRLLHAQRFQLHLQVAQMMEDNYADVAVVANHYYKGVYGNPNASDEQEALAYSYNEQAGLWKNCVDLLPEDDPRLKQLRLKVLRGVESVQLRRSSVTSASKVARPSHGSFQATPKKKGGLPKFVPSGKK